MENGGFSKNVTLWTTFYPYKGLLGLLRAYRRYRNDTKDMITRRVIIQRKSLKVVCLEDKQYAQPWIKGISIDRRLDKAPQAK